MFRHVGAAVVVILSLAIPYSIAQVVTPRLHHLRATEAPEWSDFPKEAEATGLRLRFQAKANPTEWSLRLRQQDVRQTWKVSLNGKELGRLQTDENDMTYSLPIPPKALRDGENAIAIEQVGKVPDDIRVGEIALDDRPVSRILNEAIVEIRVMEAGAASRQVPCRLTIIAAKGSLAAVGAISDCPRAITRSTPGEDSRMESMRRRSRFVPAKRFKRR